MVKEGEFEVWVYLKPDGSRSFPALDLKSARDFAVRTITKGLYIENEDGTGEYFPSSEIHKVKVVPPKGGS